MSRSPLPWIALGAVFVLGAVMGYLEIFSPDVGNHLASGRWILAHGWPDHDPLTWTRTESPYIDLLWVWHVLLWVLYRWGGTLPMVLTGIVLTLASLALLIHRGVRQDARLLPYCAPALLLFCLGNLWELRPHIASWLFLNLVLLSLEKKTYWPLPVLMLLWVNTHSLFIVGLVVLGAYALAELLRGRAADRKLLLWVGLSVVACLVNPWGIEGLLFPLQQLAEIREGSPFKAAVTGIAEFRSPYRWSNFLPEGRLVLLQPLLFMHLYAVAAILGGIVAALRKRLSAAEGLVFVLFAYVWWSAQKNFGYLVVATFPVVLRGWALLVPHVRVRPAVLAGGFVAACAFVLCLTLNNFFFTQAQVPHHMGHAFNAQMLPVRACTFLRERVPPGRLLNTMGDGGYVEFATGLPVFIDGRNEVIGPRFFSEYQRMQDLQGFQRALGHFAPQIVLVPVNQTPAWFVHLDQDKAGWRCVHLDEQSAVFLRAGFAPQVPAIAPPDFPRFTASDMDAILEEVLGPKSFRPWRLLTGPHDYPLDAMQRTTLALLRGEPEAAIGHGLTALRRATVPVPDLWHNMAVAFLQQGDRTRAAMCYAAVPPERRDPRVGQALRQNRSTRRTGTTSFAASQ
jgi:hypothetical protein